MAVAIVNGSVKKPWPKKSEDGWGFHFQNSFRLWILVNYQG